MFKGELEGDLEVNLEGEYKGDFRGNFKQDLEGDLLSCQAQVRSGPGLVQVWFSFELLFNSLELGLTLKYILIYYLITIGSDFKLRMRRMTELITKLSPTNSTVQFNLT